MDEIFMSRALELAKKGEGYVNPNPLVGAVIVKNGKVIGEGYHKIFGKEHAEINAINNTNEDLTGAIMYVTLEPCCHYGKTPPCVEAIKRHKIKKVVVGTLDFNPLVKGKGVNFLEEEGIEVVVGVLEDKCQRLNEIFNHYIINKQPFIALKWAMTIDGKIATAKHKSKWITNEKSREFVHSLRKKYKGIMVGINTILKDNPDLRYRGDDINEYLSNHFRVVLDSSLKIPIESIVLKNQSSSKTLIFTTRLADKNKKNVLESNGIEVIEVNDKNGQVNLKEVMKKLGERNVDSILVEGGGNLNYSFLEEGLVNKVYAFIAPKIFGGEKALTPVEGIGIKEVKDSYNFKFEEIRNFNEDLLIIGNFIG